MKEDTILYAVWEKDESVSPDPVETSYQVKWLDTDDKELAAPESRNGYVGEPAGVTSEDEEKSIPGYTFDKEYYRNVLSLDSLDEDPSKNVLKLYYTRDAEPEKPASLETACLSYSFDLGCAPLLEGTTGSKLPAAISIMQLRIRSFFPSAGRGTPTARATWRKSCIVLASSLSFSSFSNFSDTVNASRRKQLP